VFIEAMFQCNVMSGFKVKKSCDGDVGIE